MFGGRVSAAAAMMALMAERMMDVDLVGGPADWRGRRVAMPVDPDDPGGAGAYLISEHTPPRTEEEDIAPRAVYLPEEGGDPLAWRFRGWLPSSPSDPDPDSYGA